MIWFTFCAGNMTGTEDAYLLEWNAQPDFQPEIVIRRTIDVLASLPVNERLIMATHHLSGINGYPDELPAAEPEPPAPQEPGIVCNDNGITYLLLYSDWDYLRSIGAFDERLYLLSFGQEYLIRRYQEGRLRPAEIVRLHDEQYLLWRLGLESEDYQRVIEDARNSLEAQRLSL